MYNVAYQELQSFLREKVSTSEMAKATSIAVGVAIARLIALPSSPVEDGSDLFDFSLVHSCDQYLSEFNENIVIDIDYARSIARAFWCARYTQLHEAASAMLLPRNPGGFTDKVFNLSYHLSSEDLGYMNQHSVVLCVVVNKVQAMLSQLISIKDPE